MSDPILSLARPEVVELQAYESARSLGYTGSVYLDANESPYSDGEKLNRYPEPQPKALKQKLAALYGIDEKSLFIGRGSDDAIDALVRTFCEARKDAILIFPPTYGVYEVAAKIQGAETRRENVGIEGVTAEIALSAWTENTKLVFLCSPNNPTGKSIPQKDIEAICKGLLGKAIVVLDEAYLEFSAEKSFAPRLSEFPNLVVLRTLSKAFALAGARCGTAMGNPSLIGLLQKVRAPYPLSTPSINAVLKALGDERAPERVRKIIESREKLVSGLKAVSVVENVYPSDGNFLLVKVSDAALVIKNCLSRGVVIRDRSREAGLENCVRISVGTEQENEILLAALVGKAPVVASGRKATKIRKTNETNIEAEVNLDSTGPISIHTGIGFFDHMLEQVAKHGGFSLKLDVKGDLNVDEHHTVEDTALAIGECFREALGDKRGIGRYGFLLPMDEAEAKVSLDLSGRAFFVFRGKFERERVGELPTELVPHFFKSLSDALGATLHIEVTGENSHHMVESCFKGVGRSLRAAIARDGSRELPSTKGVL